MLTEHAQFLCCTVCEQLFESQQLDVCSSYKASTGKPAAEPATPSTLQVSRKPAAICLRLRIHGGVSYTFCKKPVPGNRLLSPAVGTETRNIKHVRYEHSPSWGKDVYSFHEASTGKPDVEPATQPALQAVSRLHVYVQYLSVCVRHTLLKLS